MKKQFAIFVILFFVFWLMPINFTNAITQNQINAEVQIVCPDDYGNWYSGSGTIIDPKGIILTNKHIVTDEKGGIIKICIIGFTELINQEPNFGTKENLNLAEVKYYTTIDDMDAAILYLDNSSNKVYPYVDIWSSDSNILKFGNKIEVVGFPSIGGSTITYTSGDFSGFGSSSDGTQNYIKTTAPLEHGNSGGAAYNSNNQFIGIPTMVVAGTLNSLSYILSVNSTKSWLSGVLGSQYKQEVIEQKPIIKKPIINIQNDITPPNVSKLELGYYIFKNGFMGDRGIGSRFISEFDEIQFYWTEDCSGVYKKECLYDESGVKGYYYYFGQDPKVNPIVKGKYSENIVTDKEGDKVILEHFKMNKDGFYYLVISFVDGANNISAPYIFEYILEKNHFKDINSIHFYKDKNYSQSLGAYNFKYEEGGKTFVGGDFDDILTCRTKLNNLYFSVDYPDNISNKGYIYDFKNFYSKYENGKYNKDNNFSLANISKGGKESFSIQAYDVNGAGFWTFYKLDVVTGSSDAVNYKFYLKPLVNQDNKYLINKHNILNIIYDPSIKEELGCLSNYDMKYKHPSPSRSSLEYYNQNNNIVTFKDNIFTSLERDYTDLAFAKKQIGKILLQVDAHGEAYYVNPKNSKRYYMADGNEAYRIMRYLGVGITNSNLQKIKTDKVFAKKNSGKIFLQVESLGEAYYIDFNGNVHYLKDGNAAYRVMRSLGLGIKNSDLSKISEGSL